jgi:hypothetical protein
VQYEDRKQGEAYYRTELFPRSCRRIRALAPEQPVDLLFVPVGTQPYPPILACLGTPSKRVVLLHSARSREYAEEVREALEGEGNRQFHLVLIKELDSADMAQKLRSCYDTFGQPPADRVVCDQTGGNKIMTSTVAGFAALNGWRQVYVQSEFMKNQAGSYDEKVLVLPNLFEALGGFNRTLALHLAQEGQFAAATASLKKAMDEALSTGSDEELYHRLRLAGLYRDGKMNQVVKSASKLGKNLNMELPGDSFKLLKQDRPSGFYYWVARTLAKEGQAWAAVGVLARIGIRVETDEVNKTLAELSRSRGDEWALREWKPLDQMLGFPYTQEVRKLVRI